MRSIPKAVIVTTYPGSLWLHDCLMSLKESTYPIVVHVNTPHQNSYDPGGLYLGKDIATEFVLLHDTCVVTDISLLDDLFNEPGFVAIAPGGLMLMGKYVSDDMPQLPSVPLNKLAAVNVELNYREKVPWGKVIEPGMVDGPEREFKNGRMNMVIRGTKIFKYKGTWDITMVKEGW